MSKNYVIVTDSTTDLPASLANDLKLTVLPLKFVIGDKEYPNYLDNRAMSSKDFYDAVRGGAQPSTVQLNPADYTEGLKSFLDEGKDLLIISFSSALSGTFNSARIAKQELDEQYPERKIIVIDSLSASMGEGLLVYLAAKEKEKGVDIDTLEKFVLDMRLRICHWFTVTDIGHLRRGGRVSGLQAFMAETLNIKPIMHVDNQGRLVPRTKVIGRKKSLRALSEKLKATYDTDYPQTVFISHGDALEDAEKLAELIKAEIDVKELIISDVGPVIGAHSGPGTIALFFIGHER